MPAGQAQPPSSGGYAASQVAAFEPRKMSLVQAAYHIIAQAGFEGLRTRDVARAAGINVATLHYYFPTKEALIGAVALYLASRFETMRADAPEAAADALTQLRREFADAAYYLTEHPEMVEVMRELTARARRDEAIARIIEPLKFHWRASVEEVIAAGVAQGAFTPRMPDAQAAGIIVALLWGVVTLPIEGNLDHAQEAIEHWLTSPEKTTSGRRSK